MHRKIHSVGSRLTHIHWGGIKKSQNPVFVRQTQDTRRTHRPFCTLHADLIDTSCTLYCQCAHCTHCTLKKGCCESSKAKQKMISALNDN